MEEITKANVICLDAWQLSNIAKKYPRYCSAQHGTNVQVDCVWKVRSERVAQPFLMKCTDVLFAEQVNALKTFSSQHTNARTLALMRSILKCNPVSVPFSLFSPIRERERERVHNAMFMDDVTLNYSIVSVWIRRKPTGIKDVVTLTSFRYWNSRLKDLEGDFAHIIIKRAHQKSKGWV